jgi:hypothetical protein
MRAYRTSQGPRVLLAEPADDIAIDDSAIDDITTSTDQWSRWRCAFGESAPASAF